MTALARLKPDPVDPNLGRLGALVETFVERLRDPHAPSGFDPALQAWPESIALARSIETDAGWQLFVARRGRVDESLLLWLDAPQLSFRYTDPGHVHCAPHWRVWWPHEVTQRILRAAVRARFKGIGRETPALTESIRDAIIAASVARWGAHD
jgi:hypothetical protein